jgi:hypothetical protein
MMALASLRWRAAVSGGARWSRRKRGMEAQIDMQIHGTDAATGIVQILARAVDEVKSRLRGHVRLCGC